MRTEHHCSMWGFSASHKAACAWVMSSACRWAVPNSTVLAGGSSWAGGSCPSAPKRMEGLGEGMFGGEGEILHGIKVRDEQKSVYFFPPFSLYLVLETVGAALIRASPWKPVLLELEAHKDISRNANFEHKATDWIGQIMSKMGFELLDYSDSLEMPQFCISWCVCARTELSCEVAVRTALFLPLRNTL